MIHDYPYTNFHDLNLDWLIKKMKELEITVDEFTIVNKITYGGAWDITKQYPAWCIVDDGGMGYISLQPVPAGVLLTDTDFWVLVADYTVILATLGGRVTALENTVGDASSGLVKDVDDLQTDITNINLDLTSIHTDITNIKKYKLNYVTPEMFGAVGDGVTNDYQAICDAIDFSIQNVTSFTQFPTGSIPVIFTKEKYLFDGTPYDLTDKYGINLISNKYGSRIICPQGFMECINAGSTSLGARGLVIKGLTFVCDTSATILTLHKPRFSIIEDCLFESSSQLNTATAIIVCSTVDVKVTNCSFHYLHTGIKFIEDTAIRQNTTFFVEGCRFTTNTNGIYANFIGTSDFIKDLTVDKCVFEAGNYGIALFSGNYVTHANITNSHFEMLATASVMNSGGSIKFDESNFVFVGTGSVGLIMYAGNATDSPGASLNDITVGADNAINSILAILIPSNVGTKIKAATWELNTIDKYYIRTVKSLNVTTLTASINYAKVEFDNDTGFYVGYFVKSGGTWTLTNVAGNLTMASDNTGGVEAPTVGRFKITYG